MTLQAGQRVTGPSSPPAVRAGDAGEGASGRDLVADRQRPVPVLRWFGLVWLTAFVVLLANQPGRMVFDTKLAVDLDPAGYFASLWHLWDPLDSFGTLHNQAVGYAVPMAPVYLAGQLAHVPVWITERLWMSLIIAAGFSGLVKLADALGIGSRNSRVLAGLVFALWPTFTIVIGSTSAAVLPGMLAPWAVLPLVKAVHPGRPGWSGPLWPAARSGAVVLLMGGVNATSTLYVLLLPGLFIVTYARGRRLVSLSLAWGAAVAAATAWWTLPLLLQGKYAFNFLPYVEQSATTTATASAAATLRGAGNWVAYLNFGTPWLPAGWAMVTTPIAIIAAAAAAGCGLYGLSRRRMPAATWLRLSAGIAAAIALAGYSGPLGGPFHGAVQHVLDGTLAPFRNVYKLEPVIAAALALGVAHATARWLAATPADSQPDRKALAIVSRLVLGFMLVGLAVPYLSGRILNPGSFPAVPRYWSQAAGFLAAHSPRNAALVVPADAHGEYLWGDPIDDPLEALGTSPWVAQGLVPYGGAGSQLVLQTAENAIESGEQVPGLGAYLERAGIRYVVVRNDLDPAPGRLHPAGGGAPDARAVRVYPGRLVRSRRDLRGARVRPAAQPGQRPAGQPDRAGQRRTGLAASARRAEPARTGPARHRRREPAAGLCPRLAGPVGGHRRAATRRRGVRPHQLQHLLHLHRHREQSGGRPARRGGRATAPVPAGARGRTPDGGRPVRRRAGERVVLRFVAGRHPAGGSGERVRRQPGDGLDRGQRDDPGGTVDPGHLRSPGGTAGQRRDTPARRQP